MSVDYVSRSSFTLGRVCVEFCRRYLQAHTILTCFSKESGTNDGGKPHTEKVRVVAEAAGVEHKLFVFNRLAVCSTDNYCLRRMGWGGAGKFEGQQRSGGAQTLLSFSGRSFPNHPLDLGSSRLPSRVLRPEICLFKSFGLRRLGCPAFPATAVGFLSSFFPAPPSAGRTPNRY